MITSPFFFNDTAPTEIYTLSLHDALPISRGRRGRRHGRRSLQGHRWPEPARAHQAARDDHAGARAALHLRDRKSTRLNSSHPSISYAVFCLKKKKQTITYAAHLENSSTLY